MHFYVVKLKTLQFAICIVLVAVLLGFSFGGESALAGVFFYKKTRLIPIYCVDTQDKVVALSFDAAWGSDKTQSILDILSSEEVPATFFLVGMWVDKNEDLVKSMDAMGLDIGTHTNLHPDLTTLSKGQIELELTSSMKKISTQTGKEVTLFRCPYGAYNNDVINCATRLGLSTIQWDVDSLDWKGISSQKISSNILTKVKPGSIVLCHNNSDHIVEALPGIISALKGRGYKFVKISDLIYTSDFHIDNTGKQIKN